MQESVLKGIGSNRNLSWTSLFPSGRGYITILPVYRMGTEQFCLRWNDFHSNITAAFSEIRDEDDFFDVTLVGVLTLVQ